MKKEDYADVLALGMLLAANVPLMFDIKYQMLFSLPLKTILFVKFHSQILNIQDVEGKQHSLIHSMPA